MGGYSHYSRHSLVASARTRGQAKESIESSAILGGHFTGPGSTVPHDTGGKMQPEIIVKCPPK